MVIVNSIQKEIFRQGSYHVVIFPRGRWWFLSGHFCQGQLCERLHAVDLIFWQLLGHELFHKLPPTTSKTLQ